MGECMWGCGREGNCTQEKRIARFLGYGEGKRFWWVRTTADRGGCRTDESRQWRVKDYKSSPVGPFGRGDRTGGRRTCVRKASCEREVNTSSGPA